MNEDKRSVYNNTNSTNDTIRMTFNASNPANTTPAAVTIQASSTRSPRHSGSSGYPAIY